MSIFFSNSATRLSVFFCLLRVGLGHDAGSASLGTAPARPIRVVNLGLAFDLELPATLACPWLLGIGMVGIDRSAGEPGRAAAA